jgi:hypothetical protein
MTVREHDEPLTLAAYAILNEPGDQARNYHDALFYASYAHRAEALDLSCVRSPPLWAGRDSPLWPAEAPTPMATERKRHGMEATPTQEEEL